MKLTALRPGNSFILQSNQYLYKVIMKKNRGSMIIESSSPYFLKYEAGKIIKAIEGSIGIFCFINENHAINTSFALGDTLVIKVKPIGKIIIPEYICNLLITLKLFYNINIKHNYKIKHIPPKGTVCCESVEVLE